ncbi:MAG TPA: hypothetical protein VF103_17565 [Polyangiaceae bacterium]
MSLAGVGCKTDGASKQGGSNSAGSAGIVTGGASSGGSPQSGAGGSAGASSGGTVSEPCADALFCDDFEAPALSASPSSPWTVERAGAATVEVDSTHHVSGTKAVKVVVPGQDDSGFIALGDAPLFPVTENAFFGRVMLFLLEAPSTSVHFTLIEASGLVPGQTYHSAYRLGGQQPVTSSGTFVGSQLMANYETPDGYAGNGPKSDCWHHAARVVVPVGRWSCFEWQYDGQNNALTLWVDGTEVLSVLGMGDAANGDGCVSQPSTFPWTAPIFDEVRVGWDSYQADGSRTLWVDDFAMSVGRIGCPSSAGQ